MSNATEDMTRRVERESEDAWSADAGYALVAVQPKRDWTNAAVEPLVTGGLSGDRTPVSDFELI